MSNFSSELLSFKNGLDLFFRQLKLFRQTQAYQGDQYSTQEG